MSCPRGEASPDAHTQRRLFAASAGYCQNPGCLLELFIEYPSKTIHVAEMAHVFAANDQGPRANSSLTKKQRGAFENLIMLCSICHSKIDKAPIEYPDTLILKWKREHALRLQTIFGSTKYSKRHEARLSIEPHLKENYAIFSEYGPHIEAAMDPESGAAERWRRKMLQKIIPNNHRIIAILDNNRHLLFEEEETTLERFRQHVDDLQARHIEGQEDGASLFPSGMSLILKD